MGQFKASSELTGKRLDEALFAFGAAKSRSKCQTLIKQGKVTVNGKAEKAHYPLEEGDVVSYEDYVEPPTDLIPEEMDLHVVYEDDDIIIIDKPAGLVVHPGAGNYDGTLLNGLLFHYGEKLAPASGRPGLVHRIDKDTSGLLAVAKTEDALLCLQAQLKDHSMHREYVALADGIFQEKRGKIIAPLSRDKDNRLKQAVDVENGKMAITHFEVMQVYPVDRVSLLRLVLETGRTHQIRAHLEYIGHPIIGDQVYGKGNRRLGAKRQLLHAEKLILTHPRTGQRMCFESELPLDFKEVLDRLR